MQSEVDLVDGRAERLALDSSKFHLKLRRHTRSISTLEQLASGTCCRHGKSSTYCESSGAPRRSTTDLGHVGELREGSLVSQGDIDEAVMGDGRHGREGRALLSTTLCAGRDEDSDVLAPVSASGPDAAGCVPEGLPLGGEVAVPGGDAEEECVVLEELLRRGNGNAGLGGSVHLGQDFLRESLGDSGRHQDKRYTAQVCQDNSLEEVGLDASLLQTSLLGLSQLLDVAIEGVLEVCISIGISPSKNLDV